MPVFFIPVVRVIVGRPAAFIRIYPGYSFLYSFNLRIVDSRERRNTQVIVVALLGTKCCTADCTRYVALFIQYGLIIIFTITPGYVVGIPTYNDNQYDQT